MPSDSAESLPPDMRDSLVSTLSSLRSVLEQLSAELGGDADSLDLRVDQASGGEDAALRPLGSIGQSVFGGEAFNVGSGSVAGMSGDGVIPAGQPGTVTVGGDDWYGQLVSQQQPETVTVGGYDWYGELVGPEQPQTVVVGGTDYAGQSLVIGGQETGGTPFVLGGTDYAGQPLVITQETGGTPFVIGGPETGGTPFVIDSPWTNPNNQVTALSNLWGMASERGDFWSQMLIYDTMQSMYRTALMGVMF
jgi:hypothetical protein